MAETRLPAGKSCGDCTKFLVCLTRGHTDDERRALCHFDPSRFADKAVAVVVTPAGDAKVVPLDELKRDGGAQLRDFIAEFQPAASTAPSIIVPPYEEASHAPAPATGSPAEVVTPPGAVAGLVDGVLDLRPEPEVTRRIVLERVVELTDEHITVIVRPKRNKSQLRRERKAAEQAAKRHAIEEQFGIQLPKPSKPVLGGRYLGVKQPSAVRYGPKGVRRG